MNSLLGWPTGLCITAFAVGVHFGLPFEQLYFAEAVALALLLPFGSLVLLRKGIPRRFVVPIFWALSLLLVSTASSVVFFDQSFLLGLAANRSFLWVIPIAGILAPMRPRKIETCVALVGAAWIVVTGAVAAFYDPLELSAALNLTEEQIGRLVDFSVAYDRTRFKFTWIPIAFLLAYGLNKVEEGHLRKGVACILACGAWSLLVATSRTTILQFVLLAAMSLFFAERAISVGLLKALGAISCAAFLYLVFAPNAVSSFYDAVGGVLGLVFTEDASVQSRIEQIETARVIYERVGVFGSGILSASGGGPSKFFGRFHPSDLGLLGIFVTFGLVGLGVYVHQLYVGCSIMRRRTSGVAYRALVLTLVLGSLATGASVFRLQALVLALVLTHQVGARGTPIRKGGIDR